MRDRRIQRRTQGTDTVTDSTATSKDKEIQVASDGTITIPAAAWPGSKGCPRDQERRWRPADQHGALLPEGVTVLRGDYSGSRMKSDGYGRYDNWGFRALMEVPANAKQTPKQIKVDLGNGVSMEFVLIKAGSFTMGGESTKDGRFEGVELPKHKVTLTKDYYLGKTEVTQAQFEAVTGANPSRTTRSEFPA